MAGVDRSVVREIVDRFERGAGADGGQVHVPSWRLLARRARTWLARRAERRRSEEFRSLARRIRTSSVVWDVPQFRGEFELDVRSHITEALFFGVFEPDHVVLLERLIGRQDVVVDVGANVGLYTVLFSRLASEGRILAVEPTPRALKLLRGNVARNGVTNVEIFAGVLGAEAGSAVIHTIEGNEEYSSLAAVAHPHAPLERRHEVTVPAETLDRMVERSGLAPTLLKVDVEGAEGLVFSGAAKVLAAHRPAIVSELDDRLMPSFGSSSAAVVGILERAGYRVFDPFRCGELRTDRGVANFVGEIVAFPVERC